MMSGLLLNMPVYNFANSTSPPIKLIRGNTSLTNDNSLLGTGGYVRKYGTAWGITYGYSIYELEGYRSSTISDGSAFACGTPTGLASTNITNTSAAVKWPAVSGALSYNLQWKASSSSTWKTVSAIAITPINLTGLSAGTTYQFQVQTVCSAGGTSSYSALASFTTTGTSGGSGTGSCAAPTGLASSNIAKKSAVMG